MANTIILVDRRDDPWKKVNITLVWKGGGSDRVWIDDTGRGTFNGSGTIANVRAPGEDIDVYREVNGNTTFAVKSKNSH